ncbi:MAG: hypothetical protein RBT70_01825 [Alphaproteobacteria bacterium]|jgi:hypothetical protein|nr:hypothetical protein [Alphaproteobacteria bacterium]
MFFKSNKPTLLTWILCLSGAGAGCVVILSNYNKIQLPPINAFGPVLYIFAFAFVILAFFSIKMFIRTRSIRAALNSMAARDPKWKEATLIKECEQLFLVVEQARSTADLEALKTNLTQQLYEKWSSELIKNDPFPVASAEVYSVKIASIENYIDNGRDTFTACIQGSPRTKQKDADESDVMEFWTFCWDNNRWKVDQVIQVEEGFGIHSTPIVNEIERNNFVNG